MPPLASLALRYTAWLVGLRVLYGLAVQFLGLPNIPATGVILASVPMVDIGKQAAQRATRPLRFADWVRVWGLCLSIFAAVQVILPAIIFAQMRAALATPVVLMDIVWIFLATAAMMVLFLWIGRRTAG
jgi:hypothetical protein